MVYYRPDSWAIVRIEFESNVHYRIICGWAGGYTQGRSWKLSSGISDVQINGNDVTMPQESGSVYTVNLKCEGLDWYTQSTFDHYKKETEDAGGKFDMKSFDDFLGEWNA